jgi:hypothetical protein
MLADERAAAETLGWDKATWDACARVPAQERSHGPLRH